MTHRALSAAAGQKHKRRRAFTLFELILAIALSVTLVALIGTAINLYLMRVDASRSEVEESQLARSILAMIADDIRSTAVYQPQDISAIAALAANSDAFDVDSIDDERRGGSGGSGQQGGAATGVTSPSATGGSGSSAGTGGGSMGAGSGSFASGGGAATTESTLPLGLSGTLTELYVDTTRLPSREELFATATGYTNAPIGVATGRMAANATVAATADKARPSDLKSVRYFIRPGEAIEQGGVAATSLAPELQLRVGGLIRQEIPRSMRVWAEQSGNSAILDSGQALIAPEVVHLEFHYFDGAQVSEVWEMRERNALPIAIEVRLWITPAGEAADAQIAGRYDLVNSATTAHEYRQTVYLPMAQMANSAASGSGGASGTSGTSSGTSSSDSGSFGSSSNTSPSGSSSQSAPTTVGR
jgi:type II secretory pathway pseudopilin PulG